MSYILPVSYDFVFFLPAGFSTSQTSDCSYYDLLNYLNMTESNTVLQIMRPVKRWTNSTLVQLDMFLLGILEVVSVSILLLFFAQISAHLHRIIFMNLLPLFKSYVYTKINPRDCALSNLKNK